MLWTLLGLSVGILAVFCVGAAELLVGKPGFEQNRFYIAGALASIGLSACCIGVWLQRRKATAPLFRLSSASYWGLMLLTAAAVTLFIRPLRAVDQPIVTTKPAAPRPIAAPKTNAQPEVALTNLPPADFPPLRVQGVVIRKDHSYAIINGASYGVGDRVGNVLVKSVDATTVMLELDGALRIIKL